MEFMKLTNLIGYAVAGAVAFTLSAETVVQAATFIDTTPPNIELGSWGENRFAAASTFGQTITVPTIDNVLTEFTFLVNDGASSDVINFAAYVMAWDSVNFQATGSILYDSGLRSTTGAVGYETFTFNTGGGLTLIPDTQYVLFLSTSNFFDGSEDIGSWGGNNDIYAGGDNVYLRNRNDFSAVTTSKWSIFSTTVSKTDTAFKASFTSEPVPETTSTLGMLTLSALGGGSLLKRKRQQISKINL
jgi:hypothetical protein